MDNLTTLKEEDPTLLEVPQFYVGDKVRVSFISGGDLEGVVVECDGNEYYVYFEKRGVFGYHANRLTLLSRKEQLCTKSA